MYEDNLYLSNLYEFLEHRAQPRRGTAQTAGPDPGDGIRFERRVVRLSRRGDARRSHDVNLHIPPGSKLALVGENGAGKTTLIKLLTRLYEPTEGRISLDGLDLREWDADALRRRIGVIFQDFVRYQLLVGENIGAGDVDALRRRGALAARRREGHGRPVRRSSCRRATRPSSAAGSRAATSCRSASGRRSRSSRAFMREDADILVLDEPTAAMDAEAEAEIFQRFRSLAAQPHGHRDLAPLLDRAHGRPDRRARERRGRRAGHATTS